MSSEPVSRLLVVDDDPADIFIVRRAIALNKLPIVLETYPDGDAFIDHCRRLAVPPLDQGRQLVLMDINMPRLSGFDALKALSAIPLRRYMPVLMFSTSDNASDLDRAYGLGANGYVKKPASIDEAATLLKALNDYWLNTNLC